MKLMNLIFEMFLTFFNIYKKIIQKELTKTREKTEKVC